MGDFATVRLDTALPSADQIRRAVRLYLEIAYPSADPPESVRKAIPPEEPFEPLDWLSSGAAEYDGQIQGGEVKAFALRLGNRFYPHMKLRLARPPNDDQFLFMVDAHDAMLQCHARASDLPAIEELKRRNAEIGQAIVSAWMAAGLPTEQTYLRKKIARKRG